MGTSHRQAPVRDLVGAGPRRASASSSALPDGYEVALGNGGTTAFWDAAAAWLVRERAAAPHLRRVLAEVRQGDRRRRRSSPTRSWSRPSPATRPSRVADPAADVIAWAHNETSTGVMVDGRAARRAPASALVLIDATSGAGGLPRRRRRRPTPTTSPRRRPSAPTAASGWRCSARPRSSGSRSSTAPTAAGSRRSSRSQTALENSRKDQTYNTPGAGDPAPARRPGRVDARRRRPRLGASSAPAPPRTHLYGWAEASELRDAVRRRPGEALAGRRHDRLRRRRSTPPRSPRPCARTASSTSSPTASSAATSCGSGCSPRSSPPTSRRSPPASTGCSRTPTT